jgi:exodeoxyribonuclease-3
MRIATWNINSINVRLPHILDWLNTKNNNNEGVDILCLQELKSIDEKYPLTALDNIGYSSLINGQKTYNGVAILIKQNSQWQNVQSIIKQNPKFDDPQQRLISATLGPKNAEIRVVCAYFPNGQAPGTEKFAYKLAWLDALYDWLAEEIERYPQIVLLGDFNIAPEDRDVHDPAKWLGSNLVSLEERAAFRNLEKLGFKDAFRLFPQADDQFSWWDYRKASFRRNAGLRIDHILLSPALAERCSHCVIDSEPRGWEQPSDHAPVIATINFPS